jgi:peptide/nickel transport system substrate-binding protein
MPPQINAAIQGYLRAVGINLQIQQLQIGAAIQMAQEGKAPFWGGSWGSNSINDVSAFMPYFLGGGAYDYARDPKVEALLQQAGTTSDLTQRKALYSEAIKIVTQNVEFVPLFNDVRTVGFSKDLTFKGYPDDLPRFYLSTWK